MNRCRAMKDGNLVWFNSYGTNEDGSAIKYSDDNTSFAEDKDAVANSLAQRLSSLRSELWYNVEHGIPLFDKVKSKIEIDLTIANIVENHPEVINITSFISSVENKKYTCSLIINTSMGSLELQV